MVAGLGGALIGAAIALAFVLAFRLVRGTRDLGSDVETATYRTLHHASQAAQHLRGGLGAEGVPRAMRELRGLLGCESLVLTGPDGLVAFDGDALHRELRMPDRVWSSGRTQVFRNPTPGGPDAVGTPVWVGGVVAAGLVAFTPTVHPPLIRATEEVAEWVGSQLDLGELDASRAALAEAELRALRAQISPHFIYNALNAIASFINTNPARARELVLEFADFTRYSFRRQGDFTTLAEELRAIHSYLLLERARFGDRLSVSLQIAPEVLSTVIPFLSVQPLVENAIQHGLQVKDGRGRVIITASDLGTLTEITVEDDGVGMDPDALRALLAERGATDHIGLRNVDTRLRQVYGQDGGLIVETNVGAGSLVRMRVPKSQPLHDLAPAVTG